MSLLESKQEWIDESGGANFKKRFHTLFGDLRLPWYTLADLSLTIVQASVVGIRSSNLATCRVQASVLLAAHAVALAVAVYFRPFLTIADNTFLLLNRIMTVACAAATVHSVVVYDDASYALVDTLSSAGSLLSSVQAVVAVAMAVLAMVRRVHRFNSKRAARQGQDVFVSIAQLPDSLEMPLLQPPDASSSSAADPAASVTVLAEGPGDHATPGEQQPTPTSSGHAGEHPQSEEPEDVAAPAAAAASGGDSVVTFDMIGAEEEGGPAPAPQPAAPGPLGDVAAPQLPPPLSEIDLEDLFADIAIDGEGEGELEGENDVPGPQPEIDDAAEQIADADRVESHAHRLTETELLDEAARGQSMLFMALPSDRRSMSRRSRGRSVRRRSQSEGSPSDPAGGDGAAGEDVRGTQQNGPGSQDADIL
jgi:hypothetical protein